MKIILTFGVLLTCLTITLAGCADDKTSALTVTDSNTSNIKTQTVETVAPAKALHPVTVYKSPTCGCCAEWVNHIEDAGFHPAVKHPNNLNTIKQQFNIAPEYQSCHTAVYGEHVFEGHIPVKFIQKFLENPPSGATGLAVPAMPLGSPGMEADHRFTPYIVYQLDMDGEPTVYATVSRMEEQY
ncbi:MAG: DUF411 domain-containing protein [Gammaproteobacteria bacterium]|nr:DUF411 domain-containing protein [Gammaproteobacteria bacterium]